MDYKSKIIEMILELEDEKILRRIYLMLVVIIRR